VLFERIWQGVKKTSFLVFFFLVFFELQWRQIDLFLITICHRTVEIINFKISVFAIRDPRTKDRLVLGPGPNQDQQLAVRGTLFAITVS